MAIAENPWRYKWRATSHHMPRSRGSGCSLLVPLLQSGGQGLLGDFDVLLEALLRAGGVREPGVDLLLAHDGEDRHDNEQDDGDNEVSGPQRQRLADSAGGRVQEHGEGVQGQDPGGAQQPDPQAQLDGHSLALLSIML